MRTFLFVLVIVLAIATGAAYAFGVLDASCSHEETKYFLTLTFNTAPLQGIGSKAANVSGAERTANDSLLEVKGKVTAVRPDKNELVVSENVKSWTFQVNKDAKIVLNDRDGKLADLKAGDDAAVTFDRQGDQLFASLVRATRK